MSKDWNWTSSWPPSPSLPKTNFDLKWIETFVLNNSLKSWKFILFWKKFNTYCTCIVDCKVISIMDVNTYYLELAQKLVYAPIIIYLKYAYSRTIPHSMLDISSDSFIWIFHVGNCKNWKVKEFWIWDKVDFDIFEWLWF